jgi:rSAM/selenodomain-associated transferase 1
VKTRLCPPLSPAQAADLYGEMLADVLGATAGFAVRLRLAPILAVSPPAACAELARHAPVAYQVVAQRGPDLSARMAWAVAEQAAAGHDRILLRGSDSPSLDGAAFEEALAALDDHDLAVCPDLDGGYSLIGLRGPAPGLFDHPMSTARVLDDTLVRAGRLGLRVHVQPPHFDIDRFDDLRRLAAARAGGCQALCPRTLAWLDAHAMWPGSAA